MDKWVSLCPILAGSGYCTSNCLLGSWTEAGCKKSCGRCQSLTGPGISYIPNSFRNYKIVPNKTFHIVYIFFVNLKCFILFLVTEPCYTDCINTGKGGNECIEECQGKRYNKNNILFSSSFIISYW